MVEDRFSRIMKELKDSHAKLKITLTNKLSFVGSVEDFDTDFIVFRTLNEGGRQLFFRNGISMISITEAEK